MPKDPVSCLLSAAKHGDLDEVRRLLDEGAPVDAVDNGRYPMTALMHAAFGGHAEVVRLLLERGADVAREDLDAFTAITLAAREGHWEVVKLLTDHGADVDHPDGYGRSARKYAKSARRKYALAAVERSDGTS